MIIYYLWTQLVTGKDTCLPGSSMCKDNAMYMCDIYGNFVVVDCPDLTVCGLKEGTLMCIREEESQEMNKKHGLKEKGKDEKKDKKDKKKKDKEKDGESDGKKLRKKTDKKSGKKIGKKGQKKNLKHSEDEESDTGESMPDESVSESNDEDLVTVTEVVKPSSKAKNTSVPKKESTHTVTIYKTIKERITPSEIKFELSKSSGGMKLNGEIPPGVHMPSHMPIRYGLNGMGHNKMTPNNNHANISSNGSKPGGMSNNGSNNYANGNNNYANNYNSNYANNNKSGGGNTQYSGGSNGNGGGAANKPPSSGGGGGSAPAANKPPSSGGGGGSAPAANKPPSSGGGSGSAANKPPSSGGGGGSAANKPPSSGGGGGSTSAANKPPSSSGGNATSNNSTGENKPAENKPPDNKPAEGQSQSPGDSKPQSGDKSAGGGGNVSLTSEELSNAITSAGFSAPPENDLSIITDAINNSMESKDEAAMFIAQCIHESQGFTELIETKCKESPDACAGEYSSPLGVEGKQYYGRGYIQLSWPENYKAAGEGLGMGDELLNNPDQVGENPELAIKTAIWYWETTVRTAEGVSNNQFGSTTKAINGPLECSGGGGEIPARRYEIYLKVAEALGIENKASEAGC